MTLRICFIIVTLLGYAGWLLCFWLRRQRDEANYWCECLLMEMTKENQDVTNDTKD